MLRRTSSRVSPHFLGGGGGAGVRKPLPSLYGPALSLAGDCEETFLHGAVSLARWSCVEIGCGAFDVVADEREDEAAAEDVLACAAMFSAASNAPAYLINHFPDSYSVLNVFSQDSATNGLSLQ